MPLVLQKLIVRISTCVAWQAWRWRGLAGEQRPVDGCDDGLVRQLLLLRGVPSEELDQHRVPTIRGFMPDPSIFRDMDAAADRLAGAVIAGERVTIFGDYDVDGATSAALLVRPREPREAIWTFGPPGCRSISPVGITLRPV